MTTINEIKKQYKGQYDELDICVCWGELSHNSDNNRSIEISGIEIDGDKELKWLDEIDCELFDGKEYVDRVLNGNGYDMYDEDEHILQIIVKQSALDDEE